MINENICLPRASTLSHFDVTQPITLTVDSSQSAVGAALLQGGKPVVYGSKTLTSCQQTYAQVEKELYAVVFGCQRFQQYIYGQKFTIETDHSPLVAISKRSLANLPARLQRMLLQLQPQPYDFSIVYKPGRLIHIVDASSRAALPEVENLLDDNVAVHVT